MTSTQELRAARDEAFTAYLAVKKAGGKSSRKLAALIDATKAWHRAAKFDAVIARAMQKGRKSA